MKYADVVVIGAGHAGIEASLASARMGKKTVLFTLSLDAIGNLPCNPSIGGTAKGHLVKEVDALGGFMGLAADSTMIQSRMLNKGKGAAVQSLRNQTDRGRYQVNAKIMLENQENLEIVQDEVVDIETENATIIGVKSRLNYWLACKSVVVATGTYLNAMIHIGDVCYLSGPDNSRAAEQLTDSLKKNGLMIKRFKTGTPARVHKNSIKYDQLIRQNGDEQITPFSYMTTKLLENKCECYIAYTNEKTHEIIKNNIKKSAIYSGNIIGTGPRYCPSIEDKIVRFPDKNKHQIFIEPCGLETQEMYLQGMSSSLPLGVQEEMYRSIDGFEEIQIMRPAYAIEYDCIDPTGLYPSLECKNVAGLFLAGQINGTSGYEEAAAQGILAGINAVQYCNNKAKIVMDRSESYIGTLIDDIVTKGVLDPYRMMTSRSEYRLYLRQDNADERLTPLGRAVGLVNEKRWHCYQNNIAKKEKEIKRLKKTIIKPGASRALLLSVGSEPLTEAVAAEKLLKRPNIKYGDIAKIIGENEEITVYLAEKIEAEIKYEGYIKKQNEQVEKSKRHGDTPIPIKMDYAKLDGMRLEAREKLNKICPATLSQASRIPGVTPNDIDQLAIYLKSMRKNKEKRESIVETWSYKQR